MIQLGSHEVKLVRERTVGAFGSWSFSDMIIRLDPSLEGARLWDTLIHELTHAVSDLYGLELSESQVTALGTGLCQGLWEWLPDEP